MRHWPFYLASFVLAGLAFADMRFGFMGISPNLRVVLILVAFLAFLLPHLDGSLGSINVFKATFKNGEGGIEIRRQVAQAEKAADKAVKALAKEFRLNPNVQQPTAKANSMGQPWQEWKEMARVSDLILNRLAERLGENPDVVGDLPLITAINLAEHQGKLTKGQASALRVFCDARHTLMETCFRMKADTPASVTDRAWRLAVAGEQLLPFI